jgi:putative oxidoreductase
MTGTKPLTEGHDGGINPLRTWLPRVALAMVFLLFGGLKFPEHSMYVRIFDAIGLGEWFRYFTGVVEIGGAVLLLIPRAVAFGVVLLGCTMVGAVSFWLLNRNAFAALVPGVLLLALAGLGWAEVARSRSARR